MAGPVETYAQLPDDSANTGKKIRAESLVVGSNTVLQYMMVPVLQANVLGVYRAATAQLAIVQTAQNATSTGFLWAHNPTATSNKSARIRRAYLTSQHSTVLATPTAPRISCFRFTFTGTASGAAITACKCSTNFPSWSASAMPSPILDLRTAVTGLTVSTVANAGSGGIVGALTAVGGWAPAGVDILPVTSREEEWLTLAPGEGAVFYQDTAGTSIDTRLANLNLLWDEVDTA